MRIYVGFLQDFTRVEGSWGDCQGFSAPVGFYKGCYKEYYMGGYKDYYKNCRKLSARVFSRVTTRVIIKGH